jgi:hypothetical protein
MVELDELLRRPVVVAAVRELGVRALAVEDVLRALQRLGTVRVDVGERDYVCVLEVAGDEQRGLGASVLHAAVACWAAVLEGLQTYSDRGVAELERFLLED